MPRMSRNGARVLMQSAVLLVVGGAVGWFAAEQRLVRADSPPQGAAPVEVSGEGYRAIVKQVMPSVVNIFSERTVSSPNRGGGPFGGLFEDPFWQRFDTPRQRRERGLGSGAVISSDGYILTNAHVIRDATDVRVFMADKREFKAKVTGVDNPTDLALLKIEATGLTALRVGDSSKIEPGDIVLALGNPFGLSETVTQGIISALGRTGLGIEDYEDFIQTDAAINPGNSGGPLVDTKGSMIGVNTAILSRSGGSQGVGFAIPSALAMSVMDQLRSKGKVTRGWLGISIQPVDAAVAKAFGLKEATGTLVGDVDESSPAGKAGVKRGDVITALNGEAVPDSREFRMKIAMTPPGTKVELAVMREGKPVTIPVELGELQGDATAAGPGGDGGGSALEGVEISELTPEIARQLGLRRAPAGVVVSDVAPDSQAASAGLRRGDVIQEMNRKPVANPQAFREAVGAGGGQGSLTLLVNRGGRTLFIVAEPR